MAKLNKTPLTIRAKRGTESQIISYTGYQLSGEFAYATDTNNLYVSNGTTFLAVGGGATPTLQSVTDAGNTTTNSIGIGTAVLLPKPYLNVKPTSNYGVLVRNSGDDNKYISMGAPGDYGLIKYKENTASAITLNAAGVGIGTTAPTEKLQVVSSDNVGTTKIISAVSLSGSQRTALGYNSVTGSHSLRLEAQASSLTLNTNTGQPIIFNTNNTEVARITDAGNVGIGTTAPDRNLEIAAQDGAYLRLSSENTNTSTGALVGSLEYKSSDSDDPRVVSSISSIVKDVYGRSADLIFSTAQTNQSNAERMRITDTGNVGIGTTAPSAKLDVSGSKTITTYTQNEPAFISINPTITDNNSSNNTNQEFLRIAPNYTFNYGSGSGTGTPKTAISIRPIYKGIIGTNNDANGAYALYSKPTFDANIRHVNHYGIYLDSPTYSNTGNRSYYPIYVAEGTSYFGGNVGIGTTSPTEKLELSSSGTTKIKIGSTNSFGRGIELYTTGAATFLDVEGNFSIRKYNDDPLWTAQAGAIIANQYFYGGYINFRKRGGTTDLAQIGLEDGSNTYFNTGNVGIGTTAPAQKLHISGNVQQEGTGKSVLLVGGGEIRGTNELFVRSLASYLALGGQTNTLFQIAGSEVARFDSSGNLGIGTTAPQQKLHVDGAIRIGADVDLSRYAGHLRTAQNLVLGSLNYEGANLTINASSTQNAIGVRRPPSGTTSILKVRDYSTQDVYVDIDSDGNAYFDGNVGIGTTAPAAKLDVDGQVHLGPQSSTGFPSIDIASNGRTTIRGSAPALTVRDNNNNGGYIDMGGGTLANINSITSTATLSVTSTNVRFGGDIGARVNILGQNSSSQVPLGLKQGASGSSTVIEIKNSSNVATMGITSEGGFIFRDSNLIGRYRFDHDYAPSPADGLTVGLDFRTENASGVVESLGYIDVTQDDISADESSMRLSVGETTPTEVMRLQSDGNVGIGTTAPDSKLHIKATSGIAFKVDPNNADKEWYIDTTNPDHLKKEGNLILNADPTNVHTSTKISFNIDGSNKASINSDGDLGVGTTAQTSKVHVDGTAMRQLRMGTSGGPSSNTDTSGAIGDMAYDDNYFYIKTINGWARVALDFGF